MATNANVNVGVTGVAQFKQGMKDAQNAVKTLDQQLKLNEAQFKLTGDAEAYMEQKTKLLQDKLEEQKRVVQQAEEALKAMSDNGVSKSSAAFQQMQQNLVRAQTDLANIQADLLGVEDAGDGASSEISEMNSQLNNINTQVSFESITEGIDGITSKLESAATAAFNLGMRLVSMTLDAASWADELATDAEVYGLKPEELQRMQKTAKLIDTSVESIVGAKKRLAKGLGENSEGVMGTFAAFGLDPNTMDTLDDKFWAIGDAIYHMSDAEEQEAYAQKVFGRSWNDLRPLFAAGRQEYEETNAKWSVVSDENLDKLTKLDDAYQTLSEEWETLKTTLLSILADALTPAMETLTGLMQEFNAYLESPAGKQMLNELSQAISGLFSDLSKIDPQQVIEGFSGVFNKITEGLRWVYDNREGIVNAMTRVVEGWAALKIVGGAADLLRLVTGLQSLTGGASAAAAAGAEAGASWGTAFAAAVLKAAPWLLFLYETLKPGETQSDDLIDASGNITDAYKEMIYAGESDWFTERMTAVREAFGLNISEVLDNATLASMVAGDSIKSTEALLHKMEDMGYERLDVIGTPETSGQAYVDTVGGMVFKDRRTGEVLSTYNDEIERAAMLAAQHEGTHQNLTTDDINYFRGLPDEIRKAVESAEIKVYIDGEVAGTTLGPYVNTYLGVSMSNLVN